MKKLIAVILMLTMTVALFACGGGESAPAASASAPASSEAPASSAAPASGDASPLGGAYSGSRIAEFFAAYNAGMHVVMRTETEGQQMEFETYSKGEKYALVMTAEGQTIRTVAEGNTSYMIMDAEKMVMVTTADPETASADIGQYEYDDNETVELVSGTEDFRGETLDYERVVEVETDTEGKEVDVETTYYFKKGTSQLRYIVNDDTVTELVSYDDNVPASIFEVPADYEQLDMNSMMGAYGGGTGDMDMGDMDLDDIDLSEYGLGDMDLSAYGVGA